MDLVWLSPFFAPLSVVSPLAWLAAFSIRSYVGDGCLFYLTYLGKTAIKLMVLPHMFVFFKDEALIWEFVVITLLLF